MAQGDLVQRMLGAATLNIDTYEEVEADENATRTAHQTAALFEPQQQYVARSAGQNTLAEEADPEITQRNDQKTARRRVAQ